MSVIMGLTFMVYKSLPNSKELLRSSKPPMSDFILLPLTGFVEPDPLPWFASFSVGKLLTLLWSFFTMVLIFAYQSNLRMHLVAPKYEPRLETYEDGLHRGQNIYVPKQTFDVLLGVYNPQETILTKVLARIKKSPGNGTYDFTAQIGPPKDVIQDVFENGAMYAYSTDLVKYQYIFDKVWTENWEA